VSALQPPLVRPQVSETKLAGQVYADAHGGRRRGGADMSTKGQAAGGKDARKAAAKSGKGTKGDRGGNSTRTPLTSARRRG
jgi:hypothetical protein